MSKKSQKVKKIFEVEFGQDIMKSVIDHYIEKIEEKDLNEKAVEDAILYGVEITMGRIIHEAVPRIADSLKNKFPGYRIRIELIEDELFKPLDIEDTENGLIINTKIKQKIDF